MGLASVPISGATPASNLKLETAQLSSPKSSSSRAGLSLIEILVTITLLVVIILGLTAMFDQTRKAFTIGLGNVDYQDAGRTAMDLITRELEQMAPCSSSNSLTFYGDIYVPPYFNTNNSWPMLGNDTTNFSMERLYFITRSNLTWNAIGYRLIPSDATNGVGTLYRYGINNVPAANLVVFQPNDPLSFQASDFLSDQPFPLIDTNLNRVIDNVVDFRIRAYDRNGVLISLTNQPSPNIYASNYYTGDYQYAFYSNAVPAYVEVELGILETPTVAQLQAYTNSGTNSGTRYTNFLTSHAAQVHIFRQRVSIPAVDPTAYPVQ
jgi:hypothetical protein